MRQSFIEKIRFKINNRTTNSPELYDPTQVEQERKFINDALVQSTTKKSYTKLYRVHKQKY